MSFIELALRYFHIACGAITLLAGITNLLIVKKGGVAHRYAGLIYFWAMAGIFVSAVLLLVFFSFVIFLMGVAVLSFYTSFSGYRVLKRKQPGSQTQLDWAAAIITLIGGIVFIGLGFYYLLGTENHAILGGLCVFFGVITTILARNDIKLFGMRKANDRLWWLYSHIGNMCGSFIAAFTAFLVQNNALVFTRSTAWIGWVLPTIIGVPVIIVYVRKYKRKGKARGRMT